MLGKNRSLVTKNQYGIDNTNKKEQLSLDETDMKILKILSHDCRISNREIARRLNLSVNTIIHRLSSLEASKIIQGYRANIDFTKLGYDVASVIQVSMNKGMIREVEKELAKLPNVCGVYDVTGNVDAIVIAKFKSTDELSNFVKSLHKKGYVERTETLVVLKIEKEDFSLI